MNTSKQMALIENGTELVLAPGSIKAAMKATGSGSRDLWQVPIEEIKTIEGLNPRVQNEAYKAHIRWIADSIKSEGFYQDEPLSGYVQKEADGTQSIIVYGGHSRLAGARMAISEGAQLNRLPVVVSMDGLNMEDITVSFMRGNGGKNLTYYETAVVCSRLVKMGLDLDVIAKRTGLNSVPLVKNRLALMTAPLKLRMMVANEEMAATLAIELLAKHGSKVMEAVESAQEVATTAGKTKIQKKTTGTKPDVFSRAKFIKKAAPKLYEAAQAVTTDPGYTALSDATKTLISDLLAEIESNNADKEPPVDPRQVDVEDVA